MKMIRTVTGDVSAEKIGRTLTHEHLLYTYPGGEYDHRCSFDLDNAVDRIANELKAGMDKYHYRTIVDMTPAEVGRHPELMQMVAQKTGANGHSLLVPASDRGRACGVLHQRPDRRDGIRRTHDRYQGRRHQDCHRPGERHPDAKPHRGKWPAHSHLRGPADPGGRPRPEGHRLLYQHTHGSDGLHRHQ